jgi:FkbM family methyltransferase
MAHLLDLDCLEVAHRSLGLRCLDDESMAVQVDLLAPVLDRHFDCAARPAIIVDAGAHRGAFSVAVKARFENSKVFAFEPNPQTFCLLQRTLEPAGPDVLAINKGLGSKPALLEIFSYANDRSSEHSSLYREVFDSLHQHSDVCAQNVEITTLDGFCKERGISRVDFLKIDVEGGELSVLEGAKYLITNDGLPIIQFEFNEMNVVSRVFLRDFYGILPGYSFFRIAVDRLVPLGEYRSVNEIFQYQNLLAVAPSVVGVGTGIEPDEAGQNSS